MRPESKLPGVPGRGETDATLQDILEEVRRGPFVDAELLRKKMEELNPYRGGEEWRLVWRDRLAGGRGNEIRHGLIRRLENIQAEGENAIAHLRLAQPVFLALWRAGERLGQRQRFRSISGVRDAIEKGELPVRFGHTPGHFIVGGIGSKTVDKIRAALLVFDEERSALLSSGSESATNHV